MGAHVRVLPRVELTARRAQRRVSGGEQSDGPAAGVTQNRGTGKRVRGARGVQGRTQPMDRANLVGRDEGVPHHDGRLSKHERRQSAAPRLSHPAEVSPAHAVVGFVI